MITPPVRNSVNLSPVRLGFLLIPLALACFWLSPTVRAVLPAPDGGYPGQNTAEGDTALFSLTTGTNNTATGLNALTNNTTINGASGNNNTATGFAVLESNTTGASNTATGGFALANNTIGANNTATGADVLEGNTTGDNNTATGLNA